MCMAVKNRPIWMKISAFSKARLLPELWRVLSCESLAVFLHFPLEEKEPWGPLLSAPAGASKTYRKYL